MVESTIYPGWYADADGRVFVAVSEFKRMTRRNRRHVIEGKRLYEPVPYPQLNGYLAVWIPDTKSKLNVHRVVCSAFHGPQPEGHEVRHLDGDKLNNRPSNLRWGSRTENSIDTIKQGGGNARLSEDEVFVIKSLLRRGAKVKPLSLRFDVTQQTIYRIRNKETWSWV